MQKSLRWILTLLLLFAFSALACQTLSGGNTEPEASATQAPAGDNTSSSGPTDSGNQQNNDTPIDDAPATLNLADVTSKLTDLTSYRMVMAITVEETNNGTPTTATITSNITAVTDPPANLMAITVEGDATALGGIQSLVLAQIGDTVYSVLPGLGCVSGNATDEGFENPFAGIADASTFVDGVTGATRVLPNETLNGVETIHYTFDQSALPSTNDLQSAKGDVYVAVDGGYMVRLVLDGSGQVPAFGGSESGPGTIHLQMDLSDVNQPLTVEPPEGCDQSGSTYPILDGATNMASLAGFTSYQVSGVTLAEATTFYKDGMATAGYLFNEDGTFVTDSTAILDFTKEGKEVLVTISEDAATGGLTVLITEQ